MWERNIVGLPSCMHLVGGIEPATWVYALTGIWTQSLSFCGIMLQPTGPHQPGPFAFLTLGYLHALFSPLLSHFQFSLLILLPSNCLFSSSRYCSFFLSFILLSQNIISTFSLLIYHFFIIFILLSSQTLLRHISDLLMPPSMSHLNLFQTFSHIFVTLCFWL